MFWVVVALIAVIVWAIGGATAPSNGGPGGSGCDRCKLLPPYWRSLSIGQKLWMGAFIAWLFIDCKIKGY